ncbi:DUF4148 domain-containing protein [Caballeronia sp. LZ034LL]|uniref:DUF4148 domain-containing protein n=1 Tax=Caballeronia sp. LZ034LL TaxID=3038567 RepID=UPI0028602A3E|nr:DUF4148 domain-containing protein [Caballeronia sp. LZ034LL]MDR5836476.1 DUF4148 domain-containing protein [Caballeronia sp. LZ034LL]
MKLSGTRLTITIGALAVALAGCVTSAGQYGTGANGRHLSPQQCVDLTALKSQAPLTRARNDSELAALEEAGYNPSLFFDPYYPDDLHQAQRIVDQWYQAECR